MVSHFQRRVFPAAICEVVNRKPLVKWVECTDENYICFTQGSVFFTLTQHVGTDDALIIPYAQGQFFNYGGFIQLAVKNTTVSTALHLYVKYVVFRIRHIHIQADALAAQLRSHTFFGLGIVYVLDLYVQDTFYKFLAKLFVSEHFLEQKIVGNGHCVPVYLFIQIFTLLSDRYSTFCSSIVLLLRVKDKARNKISQRVHGGGKV